ncbi:MAG: SRPBCC domain-containing protein [Hyphomonadaceae bacterium]
MPKPAEVSLPSDTEVRVVRTFNAPRDLVYKAYTTPALVQKWLLGPPGWSMPVCEMDVRVGGAIVGAGRTKPMAPSSASTARSPKSMRRPRWRMRNSTIRAMSAALMPSDPALVTLELSEAGGVTTMTSTMRFVSKQARDAAVSTGMTDGMEMGYQRLDDLFKAEAA